MLIEMDAVFGVSAVVAERIKPKKLKVVSLISSIFSSLNIHQHHWKVSKLSIVLTVFQKQNPSS